MMNFIKKLFAGKPAPQATAVPAEFPAYADKAIQLITASNGQLEEAELLDLFVATGIPETEATELLVFLPIAFCRHMLPKVAWPTYYVKHISEKEQTNIIYSENPRFLAIQQALASYLESDFTQADFLKVAGRSAAFHVINNLLKDNPGFSPEDVELTPEHILR